MADEIKIDVKVFLRRASAIVASFKVSPTDDVDRMSSY